jgi:hypothetical protein
VSIVKYKTGWGDNKIERVEVLRETEASVYLARNSRVWSKDEKGERREAKNSEFAQYHDTWEAAKSYLLAKAENELTKARRMLQRAQDKLGNIKGMKPPKDEP